MDISQVMHEEEIIANNQIATELVQDQNEEHVELAKVFKPKMLYENPVMKKQRHHSTVSQYQEEEQGNVVDRSIRTENQQEIVYKEERFERKSTEEMLPPLTSNNTKNRKILYHSLKKDETKMWTALQKQIEQYRSQTLKKDLKKRKRLKSHHKLSIHSLKDNNQEENKCLYMQNQLKRKNRQRSEREVIDKQDPYADLSPIPEDSSEHLKQKQKNAKFIQKLKQAIDKQERSRQPKAKLSLDHYIDNYYKIKQINPFFRKLNQLAGCIMLSIGKLKIIDSGNLIYDQGQPLAYFYVIIVGKIILTDSYKSFKKITLSGETLGEQLLFEEGKAYHERLTAGAKPMYHRQEARAMSRVCILRIKPQKYYRICGELNSIGNRGLFNLIDNLFRINYFKKQTVSHGKTRERLQSQAVFNSRQKPTHFFH